MQISAPIALRPTIADGETAQVQLLDLGEVVRGCYEIRSLLGVGGMGQVYEAYDTMLNRRVAVKAAAGQRDAERLLHEARVMAAFEHPGFPEVFAIGRHHGVGYVVMEHLSGHSLAEIMAQRTVEIPEARDILLAVARSLQVLHSAGMIHRDLKPANIMVTPQRRVVLLDFGISDLARFIPSARVAGSPHYIAPEAILGKVRAGAAHLMDLYSLGVVGYEMLAGETPFKGTTLTEIVDDALFNEPKPISALRPDAPRDLIRVINTMLSRRPGDRHASAADVVEELSTVELTARRRRARSTMPKQPIRILIVDDEPAIWTLMGYVLEDSGYELVFVDDGDKAIKAFEEQPFDVVVTDKNLPYLSGLDVLRRIKRMRPTTDVVVITGYPSKEAVIQALNEGAACLIEKPFDIDEIGTVVRHLAEKQRALRTAASAARRKTLM